MRIALALIGLLIFLMTAGAVVVKILYPNGDALDEDNRRRQAEGGTDER